jgi:hypothetical protein
VRPYQRFRGLRPLLLDALAPIALYFGLTALGVADLPALLAGGAVPATHAIASLAFERRLRPLPIFVSAMFAITGALAYLTHDPRVILLKPSIVSAGFGLFLLGVASNRRWSGEVLTPLIARGDDSRARRWRAAWDTDQALRRDMRLSCALAGLLLLAEAAARVVIVFYFTIGQSLILAHAPAIVLIPALLLILKFRVRPAVERAMTGEP